MTIESTAGFELALELSVKAVGPFTRRLMEVSAGDWLGVRGPFGNSFTPVDDAVLVGGGIGVAPLRFLTRRLVEAGLRYRLVYGVRTRAELIFDAELSDKAEIWSDDGSIGRRGLVTKGLTELIGQRPPAVIYGSGPEPMLLKIRELAREHGIPVQLSFERYMKCGMGICGHCCLDGSGLRLCVDGPILTEAELTQVTDLGLPHRTMSGARPRPVG